MTQGHGQRKTYPRQIKIARSISIIVGCSNHLLTRTSIFSCVRSGAVICFVPLLRAKVQSRIRVQPSNPPIPSTAEERPKPTSDPLEASW